MSTIVFLMKNGSEIRMKCEDFSVTTDGYGRIVKWNATGIKENQPLFMDAKEIVTIYRVLSDEEV